jgi:ABC-type glycerol-3-phosphate transport system permease component
VAVLSLVRGRLRGLKGILDQFGQGGEGQREVVLAASAIATVPMLLIFFRPPRITRTTGRSR